jgi:hypothetical protein
VAVRYRIELLSDRTCAASLEVSLAERWAEGAGTPANGNGAEGPAPVRPTTRVGP